MESSELGSAGAGARREPDQSAAVKRAGERARSEWGRFAEADTVDSFCRSWLAIQCRVIPDVKGGLVLLGPPDAGPFTPIAVWPDVRRSMTHLTGAAERAVTERRGLLLRTEPEGPSGDASSGSCHVAYPLVVDDQLHGVVVLDVPARPDAELQAILRQLHWGTAWIEVLLRREQSRHDNYRQERLETVLDLVAVSSDEERYQGAALALANELATRLACERVSVGFVRKTYMVVAAVSHSASFDKNTKLIRCIAAAMDEALDQQTSIVYPPADADGLAIVGSAHKELADLRGSAAICTVPLHDGGEIVGALTLERSVENAFDSDAVELCEAVASIVGSVLETKRRDDRLLIQKCGESCRRQLGKLVGPRHVAFKLVTALLVAVLLFLIFAKGDYRVSANATIEGQVQRVAAAPFASYIAEARARAGDIVEQDQVLAVLDDKDLKLEKQKAIGQQAQLWRQHAEAAAEHDRPQTRIAMAQLKQVGAQLELLNYQLSRAEVKAPFKGIIVSGDLSQSLGAPVEKGEVLFELAPLDVYRVILRVDERDIMDVAVGQRGQLALSSLPGEQLAFMVEKVTPVSTAEEGQNYFRVEAQLDTVSHRLRPGMEGVGKVFIDRRKQVWIWTRRLVDWVRLWVWSWWP